MRKTKRWSDADKALLCELYDSMTNRQLADLLGSTPETVRVYANRMGLTKPWSALAEGRIS